MKLRSVGARVAVFSLAVGLGAGSVGIAQAQTRNRRAAKQLDSATKSRNSQRGSEREGRDRDGRGKEIRFNKVVDLSHPISPEIPLWPGDPAVQFNEVANIPNDGYYLRSFTIGEHSGTHMNSGNSFFAGGASIDQYGPDELVRKAVVIDIRSKASVNADYALTVSDVKDWERRNGRVPRDSMVLVWTGWQDKWSNPQAFINQDAAGDLHFPGIAGETSQWLLDEREIAGVGIDTHGADPGLDTNYSTNTNVLSAKGIVLECLDNLDDLKPTGNTIVMGRLALQNGSGSPLTVLGFVN